MAITDETIAEVRARADIVAVASQFMQLKKVGRRYSGLCPFHGEKTPSFSVNAEDGLYHCLAGETRVITWDGVREIRDLAGGTHRVLTEKGRWTDAPFRSFGVQPLLRVTLTRNRQVKVLHATDGHRWFVRGKGGSRHERTTEQLRAGEPLAWSFPQNRTKAMAALSPFGIAHGIVYGDGTRRGRMAAVDLHGAKDRELLEWFPLSRRYDLETDRGRPFVRVHDLPLSFLAPPPEEESASYLAGWLAGYIAADGHVAKDGTVSLNGARRSDLEMVRDLCTRLGIGTYGITEQVRRGLGAVDSSLFRIHFVTDDLDERMFLIGEHRRRFAKAERATSRRGWVVRSIERTDRVEEVFCAEVPGTHSFVLEDNILTGNCFGCQVSGDTIRLVQELQHMDFVEAIEWLAGHSGVAVRYTEAGQGEHRKKKATLTAAVEKAVDWYHDRLLNGRDAGAARAYLRQRGFDGESVRLYRLGWAPDDWDQLSRHLGLSDKVLVDTGLGFVNKARRQQDFFRGRVLFPIFDPQDNPIGFGGRKMPGTEGPKYRNTGQTPLYDKSKVLYGLNWAKADVVKAEEVIVCEGYTDVIGFADAGVPRAVATCGTSLTEEHVRQLKRFANRLVLAFDPDAAGAAAADRVYAWEQTHQLEVVVADLPSGQDPGDLSRSDPDRLRAAVEKPTPFLGFRVERALSGGRLDTPEGRARTAEAALDIIREHPNEFVRDQYVVQVADRCRIEVEQLRASARPGSRPARVVVEDRRRRRPRAEDPEMMALRLAIDAETQPEMLPLLHEALFEGSVTVRVYRALRDAGGDVHRAIELADAHAAELLMQLAAEDETSVPRNIRRRLLGLRADRELRALKAQARSAEGEDLKHLVAVQGWLQLQIEAVGADARTGPEVEDQLLTWLAERAEERS